MCQSSPIEPRQARELEMPNQLLAKLRYYNHPRRIAALWGPPLAQSQRKMEKQGGLSTSEQSMRPLLPSPIDVGSLYESVWVNTSRCWT